MTDATLSYFKKLSEAYNIACTEERRFKELLLEENENATNTEQQIQEYQMKADIWKERMETMKNLITDTVHMLMQNGEKITISSIEELMGLACYLDAIKHDEKLYNEMSSKINKNFIGTC